MPGFDQHRTENKTEADDKNHEHLLPVHKTNRSVTPHLSSSEVRGEFSNPISQRDLAANPGLVQWRGLTIPLRSAAQMADRAPCRCTDARCPIHRFHPTPIPCFRAGFDPRKRQKRHAGLRPTPPRDQNSEGRKSKTNGVWS